MKILHYSNEVNNNIKTVYTVNGSDCKYTLNHPFNLIIDAEFIGKSSNYANSQGWERDSNKYFKELYEMHPEYFSDSNKVRIMNNKAPIVNDKFLKYFPEYVDYKTQILVLHHIGGDGQMVAIPQDIHSKGFGEIHNVEKSLGIRDIAIEFSNQVENKIDNGEFENGKKVTYYYESLKGLKLIDDDGYRNESKSLSSNNSIVNNKHEIDKKEKVGAKILNAFSMKAAECLEFIEEHPVIGKIAIMACTLAIEEIKNKVSMPIVNKLLNDNQPKNKNSLKNVVKDIESNVVDVVNDETEYPNYPKERASMTPHIRHAHLHHFGKNGAILKMLDDIHVNKNKSNGIEDMNDYN